VKSFYTLYGLSLSANRPIPGLTPALVAGNPQSCLFFGSAPPWLEELRAAPRKVRHASENLSVEGVPTLVVAEFPSLGAFHFLYRDGTEFFLDGRGSRIWARWPNNLTLEDATTYLLGPVMGFVLRLQGIVCLHASAVAIGERAAALVGPPGSGKSTTAAAFARRGYPVLTDDVAALTDGAGKFLIQPGYPRLCLWPTAVEMLLDTADALPAITPGWDKRYLTLGQNGCQFQQEPLPLSVIYFLSDRSKATKEPQVETVSSAKGLVKLVTNTYVSYLLDSEMRTREFELLGRLATNVQLRGVHTQHEAGQVDKLLEAILNDFHSPEETMTTVVSPQG
jgi:hypothetical protein